MGRSHSIGGVATTGAQFGNFQGKPGLNIPNAFGASSLPNIDLIRSVSNMV
jgi:hypothetical protein